MPHGIYSMGVWSTTCHISYSYILYNGQALIIFWGTLNENYTCRGQMFIVIHGTMWLGEGKSITSVCTLCGAWLWSRAAVWHMLAPASPCTEGLLLATTALSATANSRALVCLMSATLWTSTIQCATLKRWGSIRLGRDLWWKEGMLKGDGVRCSSFANCQWSFDDPHLKGQKTKTKSQQVTFWILHEMPPSDARFVCHCY